MQPVWICEVIWTGAVEGRVSIYGATSFQSLSLALDHVRREFKVAMPDAQIFEDAAPWF